MNKNKISFFSEARESFTMAIGAIAAHKLRSALTLLGVLVGVFSIIVVMTAMRVMQANIERQLSSLGSDTFMIRKWPNTYFGFSGDLEKYWRRKNITLAQGHRLQDKATLPASIGIESTFWAGEIQTRYKKSAPTVQLYGETPGSFPAHNWNLGDGRLLFDALLGAKHQSYRAFRMPWRGTPASAPSIAVRTPGRSRATVYASWNGATEVATWEALGGTDATSLSSLDTFPRTDFETVLAVKASSGMIAVNALDKSGAVLGTSKAVAIPD